MLVLAVALLLIVGGTAPAGAQSMDTLRVSNLDVDHPILARAPQIVVFDGQQYGQAFCTGDTAVTLTKVSIATRTHVSNPAPAVTIRADSSGSPGQTLHTLTNPSTFDDMIVTNEDFTSTGYALTANTRYWVVIQVSEENDYLTFSGTALTNHSSAETGWAIGGKVHERRSTHWYITTTGLEPEGFKMRMAVYARGDAAPEGPPVFTDEDCNGVPDSLTFTVDENSASATVVGDAGAKDPNDDTMTHSVSGTDATAFNQVFSINAGTGQITVKSGASIDYEAFPRKNSYSITVDVTDGKDAAGNAESPAVTDASVAVRIRVNNVDEPGTLYLGSTPRVNRELKGTVSDPDGARQAVRQQWFKGDSATGPFTRIPAASINIGDCGVADICYVPTAADQGKFIKVIIDYFDNYDVPFGSTVDPAYLNRVRKTLEATTTNAVAAQQQQAANTRATGTPAIAGPPVVEQTLTVNTSGIADDDGLTKVGFAYQWIRHDLTSDTGEDIEGAIGHTYTLTSDDLGKAIKVTTTFHDDAGHAESLSSASTAAVVGPDLELQSATVDGATLTLTYDGTLDVGVTLSSSAFTVNVNEAERNIIVVGLGSSNVLLTLSTAVESGEAVTVAYTKPSDSNVIKDTLGREADSFTAQEVTNNTAASGQSSQSQTNEPNSPNNEERTSESQTTGPNPPGNLDVAVHESGKLMASWDVPASGPTPTGYTVQWKESADGWDTQADVSEANVKGTSYIITGLTDGTEYTVRVVSRKGDVDGDPSAEASATPQETVPPTPSSGAVDGANLTITFNEALNTGETPDKSAFEVTVGDSSRGVETVTLSGSVVTLKLTTAVFSGETVAVDYTAPPDEAATRLQDLVGNAAASFNEQEVTNNTATAAQMTAIASAIPSSHDGNNTFTFEVRFSQDPYDDFSYKTMKNHAFTVTGGMVTKTNRLAPPSNTGWQVHITPSVDSWVSIVLPVTTDCTVQRAICTQDRRPLSNKLEVTVTGPDETLPNSQSTGRPEITGTPQIDQSLTATTSGIQDADGLENVVFQYQWLTDDAEIAGATGPTYTPASGDVGKTIKVTLTFTDDAGNSESSTSDPTGIVTAAAPKAPGAPTVSVNDTGKLDISWSVPDSDGGSLITGYKVEWKRSSGSWDTPADVSETTVTGTSHTVSDLTDGTEYTFRIVAVNSVGNSVPSTEVTGTPKETTPPTVSSAAVDGATLTITFSTDLDLAGTPEKSAFSVTVAGNGRDVETVNVSGTTVTLTLVTAAFTNEEVTATYTVPSGRSDARLQDLAGNAAASFTGQAVTNNTAQAVQLTARASAIPSSHDGTAKFTFQLRLSEEPKDGFSYKTMKNHAFTVTGGRVTKSNRLDPPSNIDWLIHIEPDGNGTVTIVLPVTTDCTAESAICTNDRRPLSAELEVTVPGPDG